MKNSQETYKRVKINWWLILIFAGMYVFVIFAYIHQWGNNPTSKTSLIILGTICFALLLAFWQHTVIINDKFVIFRSFIYASVKIHLEQIKYVRIEKYRFWVETYLIDLSKQTVKIRLKSGKNYHFAIKNASEIKDEIEKRMLITKNIPSIV